MDSTNLINSLKIKLRGYVYVSDLFQDNWKDSLPIYQFKCRKHGMMESYPHGFDKRLVCPLCLKEKIGKFSDKLSHPLKNRVDLKIVTE